MRLDEIHMVPKRGYMQSRGTGQGPQWTFAEIADHFNMTQGELNGARSRLSGFPEGHKVNTSTGNKTYFDRNKVFAWFKQHKDSIKGSA